MAGLSIAVPDAAVASDGNAAVLAAAAQFVEVPADATVTRTGRDVICTKGDPIDLSELGMSQYRVEW